MDQELSSSFALLERRIRVLQQLASSLATAQAAVLHHDLNGIDLENTSQREICEALQQWEAEAVTSGCAIGEAPLGRTLQLDIPPASPALQERWRTLARELAQVETKVRELGRVHAAMLRRARRTIEIFARAFASSAATYSPPERAPGTVNPAPR